MKTFCFNIGSVIFVCLWLVSCGTPEETIDSPHESFETAYTIAEDNYVEYERIDREKKHFYKTTASGTSLQVGLQHVRLNSSGSNFSVAIFNSKQEKLDSFRAYHGIDNEIEFGVIQGEEYYLKIYLGKAKPENRYQLYVLRGQKNYEIEPNNDFPDAGELSSDVAVTGRRNLKESNDYFQIIPTGNILTVELKHITQNAPDSDFSVKLYDNYQQVIDAFSANNGLNNQITTGVLYGERYYVKVYVKNACYTCEYELLVSY